MPHRLIEKKRRDRINLSIGCLKDLLPDDMKTEVHFLSYRMRVLGKSRNPERQLNVAILAINTLLMSHMGPLLVYIVKLNC